MEDMPFLIDYADRARAEHAGLLDESARHNTMCSQQIIHRIGIKLVQSLIDLVGVLNFDNILGWSQNLLAVQDCGDLFQTQSVLLDSQRTMDRPDTVCFSQGRVCR